MLTTLRIDEWIECTAVNSLLIASFVSVSKNRALGGSTVITLTLAARSLAIRMSEKGELSLRRRQVKSGAIALCPCKSSSIHFIS